MASDSVKGIFIKACADRDVSVVQGILHEGFCIQQNLTDKEIIGVMKGACKAESIDLVRCLIPDHLDPNVPLQEIHEGVYTQETNLACIAVQRDSSDILEYLLDVGTDIESEHTLVIDDWREIRSLLTYALDGKWNRNIICLLAERSAQLGNGSIILRAASTHNSLRLLEILMERGVNLNGVDKLPLHWALISSTNFYTPSQYQLKDVNYYSHFIHSNGRKPSDTMGTICPAQHLAVVRFLLQNGANPNMIDNVSTLSVGHMVSRGQKVKLYKVLLAHGWDMHTTDGDGYTALDYAVLGNDIESVKFLVEYGSAANDGVRSGHLMTITYKFNSGNLPNSEYDIDLCETTAYNTLKIEIIQYLISRGADPNQMNPAGDTAVESLCTPYMYLLYQTVHWLLHKPIKLPFGGDKEALDQHVRFPRSFMSTDCLMPAGFQSWQFVKEHLIYAILANNTPEYEAAIHANPTAIYWVDLDWVKKEHTRLNQHLDRGVRDPWERDADAVCQMRRDKVKELDTSVYNRSVIDQESLPTLGQFVVYNIRCHLLACGDNTTLYSLIDQLPIPTRLKDYLSLKAFVDYTMPPGKRT